MAWYWILLIVVGCILALFALLFIIYITNLDLKLIEKVYNALIKYHDKKHIKTKL